MKVTVENGWDRKGTLFAHNYPNGTPTSISGVILEVFAKVERGLGRAVDIPALIKVRDKSFLTPCEEPRVKNRPNGVADLPKGEE